MFHIVTLHAPVILSAACGSLFYGVTSGEYPKIKRAAFLLISFVVGLIAAEFVANTLSIMFPAAEEIDAPLGALIASAFAIRWLLLFRNYIEIKAEK